ncbi:MAG: hypothetical protein V4463_13275 [Pseudomonadota bacterium]
MLKLMRLQDTPIQKWRAATQNLNVSGDIGVFNLLSIVPVRDDGIFHGIERLACGKCA